MSLNVYGVGDVLVLKAGLTRTAIGNRTCRVVGLLPAADRGEQQYRVRFGSENFERRIVASDIDTTETSSFVKQDETSLEIAGEPWLKPASMRIGKLPLHR
jgi:hypothetical protein